MNIIVCVKQVPDTTEVRIDPKTGTLIRDGVPSIINPDDKNALEEALRIKDANEGVRVTVVSMGPPQADVALKEAIAMGADDAYLLSDRAVAGSDTWATSTAVSSLIRYVEEKQGKADLIFAGRQAIDGDTAQVGPQIAEHLDIPQITYVKDLEVKEDRVVAHRALEDGHYVVECKMPVLITAISELNEPRYPSIKGVVNANSEDVKISVVSAAEINADTDNIGLDGSPTKVNRSFTPEGRSGAGEIFDGEFKDSVKQLVVRLKKDHYI